MTHKLSDDTTLSEFAHVFLLSPQNINKRATNQFLEIAQDPQTYCIQIPPTSPNLLHKRRMKSNDSKRASTHRPMSVPHYKRALEIHS